MKSRLELERHNSGISPCADVVRHSGRTPYCRLLDLLESVLGTESRVARYSAPQRSSSIHGLYGGVKNMHGKLGARYDLATRKKDEKAHIPFKGFSHTPAVR